MTLLISLLATVVVVGLLAALYLGVQRGAVPKGLGVAVLVSLAVLAYIGTMTFTSGLDSRYRTWGGSPSFESAQKAGRVVATYTSSCTDERVTVRHVFAEHLTRKELGPLLWPRLIVSDAVKVVAGVDDLGRPHPRLVFDDGAGATVDQQTGKASPRADNLDEKRCCFDFRLRPPERFWLVRDGERICTFTRQPDA